MRANIHLRSRAQTTGEDAGLYLDEKDRVLHYEPVIRVREIIKGGGFTLAEHTASETLLAV